MPKCIFCDSDLDGDTKPEHILLNALGGRKTSRSVVCTTHNETFGSTLDRALTDQIPIIRNMLNLESGTGKPAPMLRNIQAGSDMLNIQGDGSFELAAKPFTLVEHPNGKKELQIHARSAEHLSELVPHIAAYLKIPEDKAIELLKTGQGAIVSKRPGVIHHQLQFGGPDAVRSMTKAALELWATVVGNDEVKSVAYSPARNFVLAGDTDYLGASTYIDARPLPHLDRITDRFGDIFNLIYIRSNADGRVVAHFTLYNMMAWQMVLAEAGGRPDMRVGLVSNPTNPSQWSDTISSEVDIDFAWLNTPEDDEKFSRTQARIGAMIERHQKKAMDDEIGRIIKSVFDKHRLTELSPATDQAIARAVIAEISTRIAHHFMGLPHQQHLAPDEIDALIRASKTASPVA